VSYYLAARLRIDSGLELEKAIQLLDKYLELAPADADPNPAAAWWRKGVAYEKLKNTEMARTCYEKSMALDPEFSYPKQSLESLEDGK